MKTPIRILLSVVAALASAFGCATLAWLSGFDFSHRGPVMAEACFWSAMLSLLIGFGVWFFTRPTASPDWRRL